MKRTWIALIMAVATVAALTWPARRSVADDETTDTEIQIQAPLEAADCSATPPTITVLGLSIDISTASFGNSADDPGTSPTPQAGDDGGGGRHGGATGSQPPGCYYYCTTPTPAIAAPAAPAGCAALVVGQTVEVKLTSDAVPLAAAAVKQNGNDTVKIEAPLQAFDATAQTVTLLGLTIDASGAAAEGADDDSSDGNSQPIDLSQLMVGQFVEVKLASSTAPLAATELQVKNFSNQIEVEVHDPSGQEIEDVDDEGNPVDDVDVEVVEVIGVQGTIPSPTGTGRVKKTLHFHTGSHGSFTLSGLATGRARVFVTRVHGGATSIGRRSVPVHANVSRSIRIRLRPVLVH
jgi:uncharacterized protein DUF5666